VWKTTLKSDGFARFSGLTPAVLVGDALEAIDRDRREHEVPDRQVEYDNRSFCPDLLGTAPIMDLLQRSPILGLVDDALGIDNVAWDRGQIAIRKAHNVPTPLPPEPHIDGFSSGTNGVANGSVSNHTATVAVFLTSATSDFAGNFTVWPGSHVVYEQYFRDRGRRAMTEPMPTPALGAPVQLRFEPGDVVLCHYQLGHSAAVNTSDRDRVAVFFRLWLRDIEQIRWECLIDLWRGWKLSSQ
jgi:hypothetical protein